MLIIEDLQVELAGRTLLKDIDLQIGPGETHILFGPNGSGKTSLLMTIMGYPQYVVKKGKITFGGTDITHAPINERAALGIGMSYQRPPTINGLTTRQILDTREEIDLRREMARSLTSRIFSTGTSMPFLRGRDQTSHCSLSPEPDLLLFDEPESGRH